MVDQFEDVFGMEAGDRAAALTAIEAMATRSVVVIGMRADAFGSASHEPVLVAALEHPFLVSALTRSEAREAIVGPAELAGVAVDDALVHVLLDDLAPGPNDNDISLDVLPLLSNALLVTWAARQGSTMTLDDYIASGGVATALQTLADDVFTSLEPGQQEAAHALFLRLVRFSGDFVARESVPLEEIDLEGRAAMDAFVAARMLTASDGSVRLSHEALLHHWPRLREWVEDAKVDFVVLDQLRRAARVWQDSGRSTEALIPVERIETFSRWVTDAASRRLLGPVESEFVTASRDHFASRLVEEQAVNARLRRGRRHAMLLTALTSAFALVAGGLYLQGRALQAQTDLARLESQSRQVALEAKSLRVDDLNLVGQMSLVAADLADTRQSMSNLLDATSLNTPIRWRGTASGVIARTSDSSMVARADGNGGVTLWRGTELTELPGRSFQADPSGQALYAIALATRNDRVLLAVGGVSVAQLWDVTTEPLLLGSLAEEGLGTIKGLSFDGTGQTLAVGASSGRVVLWQTAESGHAHKTAEVELNPKDSEVKNEAVAVALGGGSLFVAGLPNTVARWSVADGRRPIRMPDLKTRYVDPVNTLSLAVNPQETELSAGIRGRRVFRWRLAGATASALKEIEVGGWVNALAYSPDGRALLAGNADQNVYVFDARTGRLQSRLLDAHSVTGVAWVAGRPVSVGDDGTLRVWQPRDPVTRAGSTIYSLSSDRGDRYVAAATLYDGIRLWKHDDQRLDPLPPLENLGRATSAAVAIAPSGAFMVGGTTGAHGELLSWALDDAGGSRPRAVRAFPKGSYVGALAISPDSTLVAALEYTGQHIALLGASAEGDLTPLATLDSPVPQAVSFSGDGRMLAVPLAGEKVQLWDISDRQAPVLAGTVPNPGSPALAAALSPVGNLLAVGEGTGQVTVWDVSNPASPTTLRVFRDPLAAIAMVSFSPDGRTLAASGGDRYMWLWRLDESRDLAALSLASASVRTWDLRFLDGGRQLIAGGESGELRSWMLDPQEARSLLCANRGDPLTADEWERYLPGVQLQDPC